ncbi:hypothetical protein MXD95_024760 [Frankia sp. AiPa1]|nr:hypothetical protein [Frankia sp. AiPa1]MCL9762405.1 hypothetical protein [Frankia sp. AiPa1]
MAGRLGLGEAPAFDIAAVCSGFVYFMTLADRYAMALDGPPPDAQHRVVYVVRPTGSSSQ